MGSTVGNRYVSRRVVATNAVLPVLVGFEPERIRVTNRTNQIVAEWQDLMAALEANVRDAAGTLTMPTTNGFSLVVGTSSAPPGFSVGVLPGINDTTTEILDFEAWG